MKIDFETVLVDLNGNPLTDGGGVEFRLKIAAQNALLAKYQGEELPGSEQVKRFKLALSAKGTRDLSVEDVALIKQLIAKAYGPLIVGRAYEVLDGHSNEE